MILINNLKHVPFVAEIAVQNSLSGEKTIFCNIEETLLRVAQKMLRYGDELLR